jgi:hypothetical protein
MPINNKRKHWGAVNRINKHRKKQLGDRYPSVVEEQPELTVEERGNILDESNVPPRGILSIGHTGPFNRLGAAYDKTDKAAQHHDIRYGDIGNSAYFNYNDADEQYLSDIEGENNLRANIGRTFFNTKKKYAPYYKPHTDNSDSSAFQLSPISSSSDSSRIENTPQLPHSTPNSKSFFERIIDSSLSGISNFEFPVGIEERFDSFPNPNVVDPSVDGIGGLTEQFAGIDEDIIPDNAQEQTNDSGACFTPNNNMAPNANANSNALNNPNAMNIDRIDNPSIAPVMTAGSSGMRKMVHTMSSQIPVSKHQIKISNTYKVFLSNKDDVTLNEANVLSCWASVDVGNNRIEFQKNYKQLPIYNYNGKTLATFAKKSATVYTPTTWKILPTLVNENYITPTDWDNIMRMGYNKLQVNSRKVKLSGLYQLHNYTTSAQGEVQVQGSPFIEICQPKGEFFKHENWGINVGSDAQTDDDPTKLTNTIDTVVINPVEPFTVGDPRDLASMGLANRKIWSSDDDAFDGSENDLKPYYYPVWDAAQPNTPELANLIFAAKYSWAQWYPDLSRTQNVLLTDNLDGLEFNIPVDDTEHVMSDYMMWARPGQRVYKTNNATGDNYILSNHEVNAIGTVAYGTTAANHCDFNAKQKSFFNDHPPLLLRAPNHYNTGNSTIKNNCYFYATYETIVTVSQHEFQISSTYTRPMEWIPVVSAKIGLRKVDEAFGGNSSYIPVGGFVLQNTLKAYQSTLRKTHNYSSESRGDNPKDCQYQSLMLKDEVNEIQQAMPALKTIETQILNIAGKDTATLYKLQCNEQRRLQNL